MNRLLMLTALGVIAVGALLTYPSTSAELDTSLDVTSEHGPVVVELFTSQGCSSCPPADRLFGRLAGDVVPLSFHVDYWNHLGWQDPFSDARWSDRQRQYGDALRPNGYIYTPQLVINGRSEAVGSDFREVSAMLREAAAQPRAAAVALAVEPTADAFEIAVDASLQGSAPGGARLVVALTERRLEISIPSGENARRTLSYHHVVRDLRPLSSIEPGGRAEETLRLPINSSWRRDQVDVVAFVQDKKSLAIHGAARWQGPSGHRESPSGNS